MAKTPSILPSARNARHIQSVVLRNLYIQGGKDKDIDWECSQIWFSLHQVDSSTEDGIEDAFFTSESHSLSSNPSWLDIELSSHTSTTFSPEESFYCSVFQFRLYSGPSKQNMKDIIKNGKNILHMKKIIDLKLMIHLGLNLRPSYMDPSIKFLQDLPLDTFIIELVDGFYSSQSVALYLRSTSMLDSITTEDVVHSEYNVEESIGQFCQMVTLQNKIKELQQNLEDKKKEVKDKIISRQKNFNGEKSLDDCKRRVLSLKGKLKDKTLKINELKNETLPKLENDVSCSGEAIGLAIKKVNEEKAEIENLNKKLTEERNSSDALDFLLEARKIKLISQLQKIYPISKKSDTGPYSIRSLPLPETDLSSYEEETISTALGFAAHYLILFSKYTEVPLRYTMVFQASKCLIRDDASSSEFPLYWKGVEMFKFEIALVLLRRNIEQLMLAENMFPDFASNKVFPILECLLKLTHRVLS